MRIAKFVLAAATIASLTISTSPASAGATFESGYNNGDIGSISLTVNSGLGSTADDDDNPVEGVLDSKCDFHQVTTPSSNDILLVVVGHAVATPRNGSRAVATAVRCRLVRENGTVDVDEEMANETMVGVWLPGVTPTTSTSWTVCSSAEALYANAEYVTTDGLHCKAPSLLP